jgi:hypothetical protein
MPIVGRQLSRRTGSRYRCKTSLAAIILTSDTSPFARGAPPGQYALSERTNSFTVLIMMAKSSQSDQWRI